MCSIYRTLRLIVFLVALVRLQASAQNPTGWIDYTQSYYKIPVAKDGVYKLTRQQLLESGFPLQGIDPRKIQLFHRGKQQSILLSGEDDGVFDDSDFIEFYGRKNDGVSDTPLYNQPEHQPHQYYNLFTDTTAYFLTVGSTTGKRMNLSPYLENQGTDPESYYLAERLLVITHDYSQGQSESDLTYSSAFGMGEGWTGALTWQGLSRDYAITGISNGVANGPAPRMEVIVVGRNTTLHLAEIRVGPSMRLWNSVTTQQAGIARIEDILEWTDFNPDGTLSVRITVPNRGYADYSSLSSVRVTYPRSFDGDEGIDLVLNTRQTNDPHLWLNMPNAPATARFFDISDPDNVFVYDAAQTPAAGIVVHPEGESRRILLSQTTLTPAKIVSCSFRDFSANSADYVIITHPLLRRPGGGYGDPVKAYAAYRASEAGGGYDTLLVDIGQLYDQFNFGEKSPLAVYNFLRFKAESKLPSYLFLVGKGLEFNQRYHRSSGSEMWAHQDLIPTGGSPGSDVVYSMGLKGGQAEGIPTGRLSAMKSEEVAAYLEKIIEAEQTVVDDFWKKRILHLSGGIEAWEPAAFKGYLQDFQQIAEGPLLGGMVSAIAKQSRDVQVINIAREVNAGLGLITFFGHSSTSTLDFDIGYVTDNVHGYNNKGRYPAMLMNGCEVGAFFLRATLFGEDWVLAPGRGASAFIGQNAYAYGHNLYNYSKAFYEAAYTDPVLIRKGIGDAKLEAGRKFLGDDPASISRLSQVQQMILLGDPAVKLFGPSKPDLEVREEQVSVHSFDGGRIDALTDSFAIKIPVHNYGIASVEPYRIEVTRVFSDNSSVSYDSLFTIPANTDTIFFVIRKAGEVAFGNNVFTIRLDADDIIDELNEGNNEASYTMFFSSNGTRNLFPAQFAIVNRVDTRLTLQSTDVFSGEREFLVEVDTVNTFSSPYLMQIRLAGDVLASTPFSLLEKDTLAYYWRTKLAIPASGESDEWTVSTFTYMRDSREGWAQVHFPQIAANVSEGLFKDQDARRIRFLETVTPVEITTFGGLSGKPRDSVSVKIDGQEFNLYQQGFGCRTNTTNFIAFDRRSTIPYIGVYLKWYEIWFNHGHRRLLCGREPFVINSFQWDEVNTGSADLIQYVNSVAEGDSVIIYTMGSASINLWPEAAKLKVAELGISFDQINSITADEPVVILARKGAPSGSARLIRSDATDAAAAKINVKATISGGYTSATMRSSLIGPAYSWDRFAWKVDELESTDVVRFDVTGITIDRHEELLLEDVNGDTDLSWIDASVYPYLRVHFKVADETLLTATQLKKWIVHYETVPEGILLPEKSSLMALNLTEGEVASRAFRFINTTDKHFSDSVTVSTKLFNHLRGASESFNIRIKAPEPADTTFFNVVWNTVGFQGWNDLEVYANPRILREQYFDNNLIQLQRNIDVTKDRLAPVIDVTFDGKHLINGDFVSPKPLIQIELWDDNKFLLKKDTTGMTIMLAGPCETETCTASRIFFKRSDVTWHAASASSNFRIDFRPNLSQGIYRLSVSGSDVVGNEVGQAYEITFLVDEQSGVRILTPFPNPANDRVWFDVVVSGGSRPDNAVFTLYDVTGAALSTARFLKPLFVGKNQVEFELKDTSSKYLKNGVYIFHFAVTVEGKQYIRRGKLIVDR